MLQRRNKLYINDNNSASINNDKINPDFSNEKTNNNIFIFSPSKTFLVQSKSQRNIFPLNKKIKISFNKFHQYIRNIKNDKKPTTTKRPMSLHFNSNKFKKLIHNNNRSEIENDNSYTNLYNKNIENSRAKTSRTLVINDKINNNNNRHKKLNELIIGLNSQSTKNSSFILNNENRTNILTPNKFRNIAPLTFNKLKNSKFFANTKYVKGIKNRNKNSKNTPLSAHNINFPQNELNDIKFKTIDSSIKNHIVNKIENEDPNEFINKLKTKTLNKKASIESEIEKAQFFDLFPIILNQIKQKQSITDDIYGEYNKYLSNISKSTTSNNNNNNLNKKINFDLINKNPKIKYLFLENVINNLKHLVKFIDVKTNEQLDQSVINIIRDEFDKFYNLNQYENESNIIKDFLTYGYEYEPKYENIYQNPFPNFQDKGIQVYEFKNYNNKYKKNKAFFINEKEIEENKLIEKELNKQRKSLMKEIIINHNILSKKRLFEKIGYQTFTGKNRDSKSELKEDLHNILSNYKTFYNKKDDNNNIITSTKNKSNKNNVNSLLKNEQLKKIKISPYNIKKLRSRTNPKFIKINLKKNKVKEEVKDSSRAKYDNSDKNNDTIFNSFLKLKDHYENIIFNNNGINSAQSSKNKNEKINKNYDNKEKGKELNNKNILQDLIENNETNINNDNDKNKDEEINKTENKEDEKEEKSEEKNSVTKSELSEKKENEQEKKINDVKNKEKIRIDNLKKKENKNFIKSVENVLIALNHLKEKARPKSPGNKIAFNELFYKHRHHSINSNNDSQNSLTSKYTRKFTKRFSIREKKFEQKEISVSSMDDSSMSELKEFIKVKKVPQKTKKEAFDSEKRKLQYKRRDGLKNLSQETFKDAIENKKIEELNTRMKKLYEDIHKEKKRSENKKRNKKKKKYAFSFIGVDLTDLTDIDKRKKVNLNILKEDIKYKITQGKLSMVEMYNFDNFSKAIISIKFDKYKTNLKKLKERLHTMEKYFQLYYNDLIEIERQNEDEKRINKFLYNLKEEIGETIPLVKKYKGVFCRSCDFNKEGNFSLLNPPYENINKNFFNK